MTAWLAQAFRLVCMQEPAEMHARTCSTCMFARSMASCLWVALIILTFVVVLMCQVHGDKFFFLSFFFENEKVVYMHQPKQINTLKKL